MVRGQDVHRMAQISCGKSQEFHCHDGKTKATGKKRQQSRKTVIVNQNSWSTMYAADCTFPSKPVTTCGEMTLEEGLLLDWTRSAVSSSCRHSPRANRNHSPHFGSVLNPTSILGCFPVSRNCAGNFIFTQQHRPRPAPRNVAEHGQMLCHLHYFPNVCTSLKIYKF